LCFSHAPLQFNFKRIEATARDHGNEKDIVT
jgi:hypothetical protein